MEYTNNQGKRMGRRPGKEPEMKTITMTAEQTAIYDADNTASVELMRELKAEAEAIREPGETVEIYTADGIVADAVQ
jgi:hypothetical protein